MRKISQGAKYILSQRESDGSWKEFNGLLSRGPSGAWVTAFVSHCLQAVIDARDQSLMATIRTLIRQQNPDGGFAYNESVPSDADSTANAVLSLRAAGLPSKMAVKHLGNYRQKDAGYSTYTRNQVLEMYPDIKDRCVGCIETDYCQPDCMFYRSRLGWTHSHTDVTALVLQVLLGQANKEYQATRDRLMSQQRPDGLWSGFWFNKAYTTTRAIQALEGNVSRHKETADSLHRLAIDQKDSFSLANVIEGLFLLGAQRNLIGKLATNLQKMQLSDGSWPSSAIFRLPRPDAANPQRSDEIVHDPKRLFSTAQAIKALAFVERKE